MLWNDPQHSVEEGDRSSLFVILYLPLPIQASDSKRHPPPPRRCSSVGKECLLGPAKGVCQVKHRS